MRLAIIIIIMLSCVGCGLTEGEEQQLADRTQDIAVQDMLADGLDPVDATPEDWQDYLKPAAKQAFMEFMQERAGEQGPLENLIGLAWPQLLGVWVGLKGVLSLVQRRGWDNWANVFNATTGGKSSLASLRAIFIGSHTPAEAKNGNPTPAAAS